MIKGTKTFPTGFGDDSALMFAGSKGMCPAEFANPTMPSSSSEPMAAPSSQAPSVDASAGTSANVGSYGQPWPKPTIRLGRRGFHFPPPPARDGDGALDETHRQPPGVLLPAVLVGVILAVASYFFNFLF